MFEVKIKVFTSLGCVTVYLCIQNVEAKCGKYVLGIKCHGDFLVFHTLVFSILRVYTTNGRHLKKHKFVGISQKNKFNMVQS